MRSTPLAAQRIMPTRGHSSGAAAGLTERDPSPAALQSERDLLLEALRRLVELDDEGVLTLVADQAQSYDIDFVVALSNARGALIKASEGKAA